MSTYTIHDFRKIPNRKHIRDNDLMRKAKKVYIAGKIPSKIRETIFCVRSKIGITEAGMLEEVWNDLDDERLFYGNKLLYIGPYYNKYSHCTQSDAIDDLNKQTKNSLKLFESSMIGEMIGHPISDINYVKTFKRSMAQIKSCDIFVGILENGTEPFGTLVEIGFAYGLKKPILIIKDEEYDEYPFALESANHIVTFNKTRYFKEDVNDEIKNILLKM